ncbi:MAG: hypothetical protein ACC657_10300 [Thiohalomonadales bacterium]
MNIWKYFTLAILLPMVTIYITLALKDQFDQVIEVEVDDNLYDTYPENYSSRENDFSLEEPEHSLNDNDVYDDKESSEIKESYNSIEEKIKSKQIKYSDNPDYNDLFENDVETPKETENNLITDKKIVTDTKVVNKNKSKVKKSNEISTSETAVKNNNNKQRIKPKKIAKKIKFVPAKVATQPNNKNKPRVKPNKISKVKKTNIPNAKSTKKSTSSIKKTNKENKPTIQKRIVFKKQVIVKPKKSKSKQSSSVSEFKNNNISDVFDEGLENDDYENDLTTSVPEVVNPEEIESNENTEKPKRFTSNPCSGRSSRYIARCRKK